MRTSSWQGVHARHGFPGSVKTLLFTGRRMITQRRSPTSRRGWFGYDAGGGCFMEPFPRPVWEQAGVHRWRAVHATICLGMKRATPWHNV